MARKVTLQPKI